MPVVTIRGQLGSGASEIGREVANRLHVDYVDREVIAEALGRHGGLEGAYLPSEQMPLEDTHYLIQTH